jgi:hypothetical protein
MRETEEEKFIKDQIWTLLSDWDHGVQPSNIVLDEVVRRELNKQYRQNLHSQI